MNITLYKSQYNKIDLYQPIHSENLRTAKGSRVWAQVNKIKMGYKIK